MRNIGEILAKEPRLFYTTEDIRRLTGLKASSAWILLNRKITGGALARIRRDLYILPQVLARAGTAELFQLANIIQTPSYVSYLSALAFYEITTQWPATVIESANPIRVRRYEVKGIVFQYYFCRKEYYFGFTRDRKIFIAEPEKALLDALYLLSLGRYALDVPALNLKPLNFKTIERWLKKYPLRFRKFFRTWQEAL